MMHLVWNKIFFRCLKSCSFCSECLFYYCFAHCWPRWNFVLVEFSARCYGADHIYFFTPRICRGALEQKICTNSFTLSLSCDGYVHTDVHTGGDNCHHLLATFVCTHLIPFMSTFVASLLVKQFLPRFALFYFLRRNFESSFSAMSKQTCQPFFFKLIRFIFFKLRKKKCLFVSELFQAKSLLFSKFVCFMLVGWCRLLKTAVPTAASSAPSLPPRGTLN